MNQVEDGQTDVVLNQTCFYARGGGQDWDMGVIKSQTAEFAVSEVRLDENSVVHHIGKSQGSAFLVGDKVICTVDEERRTINTRLHSAAHVIDMALDSLGYNWRPVKGQHYPNLSAVEYVGELSGEEIAELRPKAEAKANELAAQDVENKLEFMPFEQMHSVCKHVPDNIPKNKPGRVVIYAGSYGIPCGGTHVKNVKQVGTIKIPKIKSKKGIIRVSYSVEGIN